MQKLLRWGFPAVFLRRKRDESRLKSIGLCLISGLSFGGSIFAVMVSFIKPPHPIPLYFVYIAAGIFIFAFILLYWLMAFISPMVVLYDRAIWLKYGYSRYFGRYDDQNCVRRSFSLPFKPCDWQGCRIYFAAIKIER